MLTIVDTIRQWALGVGGSGLFVIALLDSSVLSFPQVADALVLVQSARHPRYLLYYAGMATLGSLVDPADALVIHYGEVLGFLPVPGREASVQARLLGRHHGYECWKEDELPARWHYGSHPRIPPIVCQMEVGWMAIPRERIDEYPPGATRGAHGFDPQSPQMRAIFIADGPAFADGVELPPIDNVDVYPLLARLLGVPPADNDGDIAHVEPALREP